MRQMIVGASVSLDGVMQAPGGNRRELKLPVRFLGVGETMEDLVPFDAESFAAALFSRN